MKQPYFENITNHHSAFHSSPSIVSSTNLYPTQASYPVSIQLPDCVKKLDSQQY